MTDGYLLTQLACSEIKSWEVFTYQLQTIENSKQSALKVITVGYKTWSLIRGSNYSD